MNRLFVLFVAFHFLADLALPTLPGAFRFDPDESVLGTRVQPTQTEDVAAPALAQSLRLAVEAPRLLAAAPAEPARTPGELHLLPVLPRRNPSSDRSPQSPGDDA